jgi:hypothetical protein
VESNCAHLVVAYVVFSSEARGHLGILGTTRANDMGRPLHQLGSTAQLRLLCHPISIYIFICRPFFGGGGGHNVGQLYYWSMQTISPHVSVSLRPLSPSSYLSVRLESQWPFFSPSPPPPLSFGVQCLLLGGPLGQHFLEIDNETYSALIN